MASRTQNSDYNEEIEQEVRITPPIEHTKEEMTVIIDGDSISWIASYTGKDELGNKKPDYTPEEYHIAEGFADEIFMKIVNSCEEFFNVKSVYLCLKGKCKNPRYNWLPSYKGQRPPALPIINHLSNYLATKHNGIFPELGENDDLIAELVSIAKEKAVICSFDKDIFQVAVGNWFLNYRQWTWSYVDKERAKYLFAQQMVINDTSDNIKLTPKVGLAFANKVLREGMTDWEYFTAIFSAYQKAWKDDNIAWEKMQLAWKLLKLHTVEELKQLVKED